MGVAVDRGHGRGGGIVYDVPFFIPSSVTNNSIAAFFAKQLSLQWSTRVSNTTQTVRIMLSITVPSNTAPPMTLCPVSHQCCGLALPAM